MKPTDVSAVVDQQRHSARTQRSNKKAFSADAALLPPHPDQSWMPELHIADPGTAEVRGEHADDYDRRSRVFCRTSPRTQPFRRPRTPPLFLNNPPALVLEETLHSAAALDGARTGSTQQREGMSLGCCAYEETRDRRDTGAADSEVSSAAGEDAIPWPTPRSANRPTTPPPRPRTPPLLRHRRGIPAFASPAQHLRITNRRPGPGVHLAEHWLSPLPPPDDSLVPETMHVDAPGRAEEVFSPELYVRQEEFVEQAHQVGMFVQPASPVHKAAETRPAMTPRRRHIAATRNFDTSKPPVETPREPEDTHKNLDTMTIPELIKSDGDWATKLDDVYNERIAPLRQRLADMRMKAAYEMSTTEDLMKIQQVEARLTVYMEKAASLQERRRQALESLEAEFQQRKTSSKAVRRTILKWKISHLDTEIAKTAAEVQGAAELLERMKDNPYMRSKAFGEMGKFNLKLADLNRQKASVADELKRIS